MCVCDLVVQCIALQLCATWLGRSKLCANFKTKLHQLFQNQFASTHSQRKWGPQTTHDMEHGVWLDRTRCIAGLLIRLERPGVPARRKPRKPCRSKGNSIWCSIVLCRSAVPIFRARLRQTCRPAEPMIASSEFIS